MSNGLDSKHNITKCADCSVEINTATTHLCEAGCGEFCPACIKEHTTTFVCRDCKMVICIAMADNTNKTKCFYCQCKHQINGIRSQFGELSPSIQEKLKDVAGLCDGVCKMIGS